MKLYILVLLITVSPLSGIAIRPITMADVPSALALDAAICTEYFKPMFVELYPESIVGKDPDYCLSIDIANDTKLFPDCAQNLGNEKCLVAVKDDQVIGLIVVHQEDVVKAEVDLLLVDHNYRGCGVGTQLMHTALALFDVKQHGVYVFSRNYKALNFYTKQGFVIVGPGPQDKNTPYGPSFAELYVYLQRDVR